MSSNTWEDSFQTLNINCVYIHLQSFINLDFINSILNHISLPVPSLILTVCFVSMESS